jgi:hypothetical protein
MSDRLSDYTEMIRDFHADERRKRVSNSQPLKDGWYKFFGWAGSIIVCALFWGFVLGKIFGRMSGIAEFL